MKAVISLLLVALLTGTPAVADPVPTFSTTVTPTITTDAYAAGDAIGGEMEFVNVCAISGRSAEIREVIVTDKNPEGLDLGIVFFSGPTTTPSVDNAGLDIADGDLVMAPFEIPLTVHKAYVDNGTTESGAVSYNVNCTASRSVYARLVARHASGTLQYSANGDISVTVKGFKN